MGKTVLITGAGSGFGKAAAIELARRGHNVIATTETQEQADALSAELPDLTVMKLDVTDVGDVASAATLVSAAMVHSTALDARRLLFHQQTKLETERHIVHFRGEEKEKLKAIADD